MIAAQLIQFSLGMALLLTSSYLLVKIAIQLASSMRISPLLVGLTVVALGTSLPEAVVSSLALIRHDPGLAEGNIIGSNISNILLILPFGILTGKLRVGRFKTQRSNIIHVTGALGFGLLLWLARPPYLGWIFLFLAITYTFWVFAQADKTDTSQLHKPRPIQLHMLLILLASLGGLTISGLMTVSAVETLSVMTGYSTSIFGLSLTAVATSLPELFITFFSQQSKQGKLTLGNIIGSNIYNLFFIGGIIGFSSRFESITWYQWGFFIFSTLSLGYVTRAHKGKTIPRQEAFVLLFTWAVFLLVLATSR
jgi:cation:H+ antiporter